MTFFAGSATTTDPRDGAGSEADRRECTEPEVGRRERKKEETRRRIRTAALHLATGHGVEHLTIEDISEAADVSTRTFFNYFSCKEDALVADTHGLAEELRHSIPARPADETPLRALRHALTENTVLRSAPPNRARALARYRLVRDNPSLLPRQLHQFARVDQAIAEAVAERLHIDSTENTRVALLASVAVAVLRLATKRWASNESASLPDLIDEAFDLLEDRF
jgi:AcrR family transcriptional regulator